MGKNPFKVVLFIGFIAIVMYSCTRDSSNGVPGGQAATKAMSRGEVLKRPSIEIRVDGKPYRMLQWQDLQGLREEQFGTGLGDIQTGYPLLNVLAHLDIHSAQSVTLYGMGLKPVILNWEEIAEKKNRVLLGLTHKGTAKVIADNPAVLNRNGWVRHLLRIDVNKNAPTHAKDGRISEPGVNPLHPRKRAGEAK